MSNEDVNTLEHLEDDVENTETEELEVTESLEEEKEEEPSQEDNEDSSDQLESEESVLSIEEMDSLNDEEFNNYLDNGIVPEHIKNKSTKKEETKDPPKDEPAKKEAVIPKTKETKEPIKETQEDVDYKGVYDKLFSGFKANGKEIKPRTVDDIISLMQQGANYTKKMQSMAPMRKTVESLNKANIKENDLNFLIDIHNGDKEAIKQLLSKHKVDPIDLDMDNTNYVPKNNIASDDDVEYAETLEDVQDSTLKIAEVMKQWDSRSRQQLLGNTDLLRALHEEISMGRFDSVQAQLEQEKTFGRYKGKSDLEAYTDLVSKMVAEQQSKSVSPIPKISKPTNTPKKEIPDKKGAAPNKAAKVPVQQGQRDLSAKATYALSDEEFLKLDASLY